MFRVFAALVAASLLWAAAPARAGEPAAFTRLVIPVVNQSGAMLLLRLDGVVKTPGHHYLGQGKSVTLTAVDPAREGPRQNYQHVLAVSQGGGGFGPVCRVTVDTANQVQGTNSRQLYCAATADDDACQLQVYNEAQICFVLVTVR
jgi:hypothetical protein